MRNLFIALALAGLGAVEAQACSPVSGYRVPTNIELLAEADLVVLARTGEGPQTCEKFGERQYCRGNITLTPEQVLKGEVPGALSVEGILAGRRGEAFAPMPTPLDRPNPSALCGGCVRQAYAKGNLVLAMFDVENGVARPLGHAFARAVEDVDGPQALWVRAAQLYLRVLADNPPEQRRAAFTRERDLLLAQSEDVDAQAIARDIDAYLMATAAEAAEGLTPPSTP